MKKAYISPKTTDHKVELGQLLTVSFAGTGADVTGTADIFDTDATGDAMAKDHSFDIWGE